MRNHKEMFEKSVKDFVDKIREAAPGDEGLAIVTEKLAATFEVAYKVGYIDGTMDIAELVFKKLGKEFTYESVGPLHSSERSDT